MVEVVKKRAVSIYIIVIPRSRNKVPILCQNVSLSTNFSVVCLILATWVWIAFRFWHLRFRDFKALLIPQNSGISRSVFCDGSHLSVEMLHEFKDESSIIGILSISISFGNSQLSLIVALKNLSNAGGIWSMSKKFFITFTPSNLSFNVSGA